MSFTIKQQLTARLHFPAYGVEMPNQTVETDVTYTGVSFQLNGDMSANAQIQVSVEGCFIKGSIDHYFQYSGQGNPLIEAEQSLKAQIEAHQAGVFEQDE
ncbi:MULTISPECIES: hypothetical protein [Klebsiella]|uniref:hypothetical protein n=1 Tax=Klebsiella TaxID=570 RepID=UPI000A26D51C|nr:hypothetical protein [Klebsiella pneumoniae]HBQ8816096.1 hypothetical protein [Klebsiella pneumoniae]HBT6823913.1 hypothetical protein [Klebsiella pneumoniae]HBY1688888.1 hypothetical protein [Klebsiella pneumoniae]HDT4208538.1 hypothetical protein [Klebsiella pneumoniae subsp. pneumoniae]